MATKKDRLRRSMMFLPANNPSMILDAHIYGPDSIMIDLEDATSVNQKDAARFLVHHALKTIDYGNTETVVRINGLDTPFGKKMLEQLFLLGLMLLDYLRLTLQMKLLLLIN